MKLLFVNVDKLVNFADEIHFDSAGSCIVDRAVAPLIEIEISTQLTVYALQHIQIELRSDTGGIVVSGFKQMRILF